MKKITKEEFKQKTSHFKLSVQEFFGNNTFSAALDNVLAMFPSTVLMPIMINAAVGYELFDISLVLFLTGVMTFLFTVYTQGRMPGYLGSSFAYIGITAYIVGYVHEGGAGSGDAMSYVVGSYICAGGFLFLFSLLCRIGGKKSNEKVLKVINAIIPTAVMGPAISLIGLELSGQSVVQAGLANGLNINSSIALLTIVLVIFLSVTRRPFFKKSSILLGILIASIVSIGIGQWDITPVFKAPVFRVPEFKFVVPKFSVRTVFMVFPPTLILFCEHIGRKVMVDGLQKSFYNGKLTIKKPKEVSLFRTISGNAFANILSGLFCGVPLTLYAENIAVMRINNDIRPNQFYVSSVMVILLSFSGNLLTLVQSIPDPILGGLSLVLMGIIAAPGIKMLVDDKVDYSKITNLFLTASVLIAGLSNMSVNILGTEFKGMSLGLIVGIVLNALFKLFSFFKISKEHMGFDEILEYCKSLYSKNEYSVVTKDNGTEIEIFLGKDKFIGVSNDYDSIRVTIRTDEADDDCLVKYKHKKIGDWLALEVDGKFSDSELKKLIKKSYDLTLNKDSGKAQKLLLPEKCMTSGEMKDSK